MLKLSHTRIDIVCKDPYVAEKEIKRSRNEAKIHRSKLVNIILKKIMKNKGQETSSSIHTKIIHYIFNEANYKVKSVLEEDYKQMELWKFYHEHFTSVHKMMKKMGELVLTRFS